MVQYYLRTKYRSTHEEPRHAGATTLYSKLPFKKNDELYKLKGPNCFLTKSQG